MDNGNRNSELEKQLELLKQEKESMLYFEEKTDILTTRIDKYLKQTNIAISVIPVKFILDLNGIENNRSLYVLDFIGIRDTNNTFPIDMNRERYMSFIWQIDAALNKNGLSTVMKMSKEQRQIFDRIIRKREEEQKNIPQILSYDEWYKIVRRKAYSGISQQIEIYLNKKNRELLTQITSYVAKKCSYVQLSDKVITQFMNEVLSDLGITLKELRHFDKEQYQSDLKRGLRR